MAIERRRFVQLGGLAALGLVGRAAAGTGQPAAEPAAAEPAAQAAGGQARGGQVGEGDGRGVARWRIKCRVRMRDAR